MQCVSVSVCHRTCLRPVTVYVAMVCISARILLLTGCCQSMLKATHAVHVGCVHGHAACSTCQSEHLALDCQVNNMLVSRFALRDKAGIFANSPCNSVRDER